MTTEHTLIAGIDQAEIILRMIEATSGLPRPAVAAMKYVEECIQKGQIPS